MSKTNIEWVRGDDGAAGMTWNPVVGCAMVSPGCTHCYAETMSRRLAGMAVADLKKGKDPGRKANYLHVLNDRGKWNGSVTLVPEALADPLGWRTPRKVFVNSMSDLFHVDVPFGYVDQVMAVMALTPWHTYQILTKRPERTAEYANSHDVRKRIARWMRDPVAGQNYVNPCELSEWPLPNVWLGTSVEDQVRADERIPHLLRCPAAVRFLSIEPLLGAIDLGNVRRQLNEESHEVFDALHHKDDLNKGQPSPGIDWVIVGGESGHGARPMNPQWVRDIRDQCVEAGTKFFHKQWGEWLPYEEDAQRPFWNGQDGSQIDGHIFPDGLSDGDPVSGWYCPDLLDGVVYRRVGKKAAGRLLDGRTWDEMPAVLR